MSAGVIFFILMVLFIGFLFWNDNRMSNNVLGVWYGKIGYDREGIIDYVKTIGKSEARAYCAGFKRAMEECEAAGESPLEDYWVCVDQVEPVDE